MPSTSDASCGSLKCLAASSHTASRHRILAVAEPGHRFRQRQRGPLGVGEIGRIAPGTDREQPLIGLAGAAGEFRVHVDADAASVDLAGAQMHQFQQPFRQRRLGALAERLQRLHGLGNNHHRVVHAGFHHIALLVCLLTPPCRSVVTSAGLRSSWA
jgi:hypothetical protein